MITLKRLVMVLLVVSFLAGCDLYGKIGGEDTNIQGALPPLLHGTWIFPSSGNISESYIIDNAAVIDNGAVIANGTVQYDGGASGNGTSYKGSIVFVSNYSSTSGVIIIKYTEAPAYSNAYGIYNGNPFFGIYYRNLKNNTVQLANSTNLGDNSGSPDTATLDEAIAKFTRLNMVNYVDWSNVNPQSKVQQ